MKVEDIKPGTRVVVRAEMEKDQMMAKTFDVGVAAAAKKRCSALDDGRDQDSKHVW